MEPDTLHGPLRFPRGARITRGAELQRIAQEGKRIRTALLEVRVVASPSGLSRPTRMRIGLIVPRYRHSAVTRNKVKRRLRELLRTRLLPADIPVDAVIRIRPEAYGAAFAKLASDVDRIFASLGNWRADGTSPSVMLDKATGEGPGSN